MNIQESWEKALKQTEVIRPRIMPLSSSGTTHLPYIFLAESSLNMGDTVVRKGEILVDKPSIVLPGSNPQFKGFEFEEHSDWSQDFISTFLLVRGIRFPSLKYENKTSSLDIYEDRLKKAIDHYVHMLEKEENVNTGLVIGPEDCWQFSVLILICSEILKAADGDIRTLLESYKRRGDLPPT